MRGLDSTGTLRSSTGIRSATRAIEACASTTTSDRSIRFLRFSRTILSWVAVSPRPRAAKAPSQSTVSMFTAFFAIAARSSTSAEVGFKVVYSVAMTPMRAPSLAASSAIASSTFSNGTPIISFASSTSTPSVEHVSITAAAPDSSAKEARRPRRRPVLGPYSPEAMTSLRSPSSTRWMISIPGMISEASPLNTGTSDATECTIPAFCDMCNLQKGPAGRDCVQPFDPAYAPRRGSRLRPDGDVTRSHPMSSPNESEVWSSMGESRGQSTS